MTEWDTTALEARGAIVAGAELLLFDPADFGGQPLWSANVTRRIPGLDALESDADRIAAAARAFAREALTVLPERDPVAAHR